MKTKISTYHICALAFAIAINFVGGQIALYLHLPIYLDSIGTFFIAATCGPIYGMIPNALSGILMWALGDVFSLYYAPVGILLGLLAGFAWQKKSDSISSIFFIALLVTIPTSFVSAFITAGLFGGITSSGSTVLVQILAKVIGLTPACFVVQVVTDYVDRVLALIIATILVKRLPVRILNKLKNA